MFAGKILTLSDRGAFGGMFLRADISMAVPICNSLTFMWTWVLHPPMKFLESPRSLCLKCFAPVLRCTNYPGAKT